MNLQLPYCFCFFLLLQLPFSTNGQAYKNVSLGSSLTAASGDLPWTSPSGEFAFGFQQVSDAGYLLSIWFNKIPERTIVWSANRNNLAQRGSTVQLTAAGQLVLNDQSGRRIWTTRYLGGSGAAYGAMLDTGNFVLSGQAGDNLWESFDKPTDTLLPTQNLKSGAQLIAPYLEKNYSDGRFKLILQTDGNLVMYTTAYPLTTYPKFRLLVDPKFYRVTIDYDGVFRQYVYPKTACGGKSWAMNWTTLQDSIPSNICLRISYAVGSGACGFNSYCELEDDKRPSCRCAPGYSFYDQDDERKGLDEDWCRQACLSDCYCAVATFQNGQCWKKRGPLSNGVTDPTLIADKALLKVRKDNRTEELAQKKSAKKSDRSALIISGSVLLGSSIFLIVLYVFFTNRKKQKVIPQHHAMRDMNLQNFTYNELETATGGFNEELGRGAFGPVYKGVLGDEDEQMIAVKRHHVLGFAHVFNS
ncbi:G-TYPE LECTIN S-RECEPTOR-LIKE SERINE/THREONINE-PROTEIN KINASE SD2-5 [Salix purpurea]|uniref:G-TYPE LECTIN S-RECEPTOR-LIKE SERINE/THREONINE-PROTEIN KINASE SD2-5 n=1 Tax=Salix purpurea TaxID=77065 RepID=A0A9Q0QDQ4_SALPP|nr:G-TYPE LECTIN S-RECEPTOR-LIKE SERINE/THREONINE-PROTEIN KINASE SD2-5 [Salix purpurea]